MTPEPRSSTSSPAPVHVIHLIGTLDIGGAESVSLDLCRRIDPREVTQHFLCLSGHTGSLVDEFRSVGASATPLPLRPLVTFPFRLWLITRAERPDVIMSHVSLASGPLLTFARMLGVRQRVARVHSEGDGRGTTPTRLLYRAVARRMIARSATHVLGVTAAAVTFGLGRRADLARRRGVIVGVVPNGVDTLAFTPRATPRGDGPLVVVHVGRSAPEKNRHVLPQILSALRKQGPAEMRIVGPGSTDDLGPGRESVVVVGPTRDVAAQLRDADALILPSLWEGLPGVVLEALACGVPVVASDLPGLREIRDTTPGVHLVDLDASPQKWADALLRATSQADTTLIRSGLMNSPFALDRTVLQWRSLWNVGSTEIGRDA